jgi:ribonucleoside-diphosphate reductase alpha chain
MEGMMSVTLSDNALVVLKSRYLAKNGNGTDLETPEQMFRRVAKHIASVEEHDVDRWEREFYHIMSELSFLPNTPTLVNAGRPFGMLSACFVLSLEDSLAAIYQTITDAVSVQAMGGGTGYPLHNLRPKGDLIQSTGRTTSGPVSFLKVIDANMGVINQGGVRKGANMATMAVWHPDIEEFIDCKKVEGTIHNFNLSVGTTDTFIHAVKTGGVLDLINPRTGQKTTTMEARKLWRKIAEGVWRNGEPGIIYLDEINRHHSTPDVNRIETTNPCGEEPLPANDSCNLGSINLNAVLYRVNGKYAIDFEKLASLVQTCTRFLDNVVTINKYPIQKIAETSHASRRLGLGIMGLADVLMLTHTPYDSDDGRALASSIMRCINTTAHEYSRQLARERGAFPLCDRSIYRDDPRCNATLTTIAPTGSISTIASCSSGCEPPFAITYTRNILEGKKLIEISRGFRQLAEDHGFWSPSLAEEILERHGSIQSVKSVPDWAKHVAKIASEIPAMDHVRMQAALQQHVDAAISKTINAPNTTTVEEVEQIFMYAHECKCRGLTLYREGSRQNTVLVKEKEKKEPAKPVAINRPQTMVGSTHKMRTGFGGLYVTLNRDSREGPIRELFVQTQDVGGETRAWSEFASRAISYALRLGMPPEIIIKAGKHVRGSRPIIEKGQSILSGPDAVAKAMELELNKVVEVKDVAGSICPDCSSDLVHEEGCRKCHSCGYSQCGGG